MSSPPFSSLVHCFSLNGVARYRVSSGEEIVVEPFPGMARDTMRLFLLSTGLGALLQQRLVLVLHGSCIVTPRGAVIFAGQSGSGKSTLAAAFCKRGFQVLTDEISAIEMSAGASVLPGPSALMLWKDSLSKLSVESSPLIPVRPELQKYFLPLGASHASGPVGLKRIYVLEMSNRSECSLVPLLGFEKFKAVAANLYRPCLAMDMGLEGVFGAQLAQLAGQTEITRMIRPNAHFRLDQLIDTVERDLA